MLARPREKPNTTSFSNIVGKHSALIFKYFIALLLTVRSLLLINKPIISPPKMSIRSVKGIPRKKHTTKPLKNIFFSSLLLIISSSITLSFFILPKQVLTIDVVAVQMGYAAAAITLKIAPFTLIAANDLVANDDVMNLPTQNVSTRVRIGSAMQAAKLGIAIASICWYSCLLVSLFLSLVISIDDNDNDVLDNDDLDNDDNDDLGNDDVDNDDNDNDDLDNDDLDNDDDNVSSDDIINTITTLW